MGIGILFAICVLVVAFGSCLSASRTKRLGWGDVVAICILICLLIVIIMPVFSPRRKHNPIICLSNMKQLGLAVTMYAADYDAYPDLRRWNQSLNPYLEDPKGSLFHCPNDKQTNLPGYAMNAGLRGQIPSAVESQHLASTVMLFESIPGKNLSGGRGLLPKPSRHNGGHFIAFLDGHAKWVSTEGMEALIWNLDRTKIVKPGKAQKDKEAVR